ncbi:MAG: dethiobiotin synthase, partial [Actinomycetota bacterium]
DEHLERVLEAFARARARARARAGAPPVPRRGRPQPPAAGPIDPRILSSGGVFVTGTGTGVGKTVVVAALSRVLASAGLAVGAMKPVQTGAGTPGTGDVAFVVAAGGVAPHLAVTPYAFADPLAPAVAARMAGRVIDLAEIIDAFGELRSKVDLVVVEGSGGLLVPLTERETMADLAGEMRLPVVVVASPALGTLNHTALTVEVARARGLEVLGVVLSGFPAHPDPAEATNPAEIERLAATTLLGVLPELAGLEFDMGDPRPWLAHALGGCFYRPAFLDGLADRPAFLDGLADAPDEPRAQHAPA